MKIIDRILELPRYVLAGIAGGLIVLAFGGGAYVVYVQSTVTHTGLVTAAVPTDSPLPTDSSSPSPVDSPSPTPDVTPSPSAAPSSAPTAAPTAAPAAPAPTAAPSAAPAPPPPAPPTLTINPATVADEFTTDGQHLSYEVITWTYTATDGSATGATVTYTTAKNGAPTTAPATTGSGSFSFTTEPNTGGGRYTITITVTGPGGTVQGSNSKSI